MGRRGIYTQRFLFKNVFAAVGVIFTIVGVVFVAVAAGLFISTANFLKQAVPVEGEIRSVSRDNVIISYEIDGEYFESPLGYYSSDMRRGDPITVYCNPDQPDRIRSSATQFVSVIFGFVGILLLIVGSSLIIYSVLKKSKEGSLKSSGMRLDAQIIGVSVDPKISSNYQHPYILECQYQSPDGRVYFFRSGHIWYDPTNLLTDNHVPVYVERGNFESYYVDISQVLPKR
ncbi:MAG: DUF3592 domain-containing protein [Lachnospiraceae bacterium]|jgi:hypothetical protein|nr:DUF3592 domain-containing protein [Lachnospiraceae bacterium]